MQIEVLRKHEELNAPIWMEPIRRGYYIGCCFYIR